MLQRLIRESGIAAGITCLLTPIAYLFATRRDSRLRNAFQDHWETMGAGFLLVVLGLVEMSRGVLLCCTVLGAFEEANLKRGAGSILAGAVITALGGAVLYKVVFG